MSAFFTSPPQLYPFITSPEGYPSTLLPTFSPPQLPTPNDDLSHPPPTTVTASIEGDSSLEGMKPRRVAFDAAPSYLEAKPEQSHGQIDRLNPIQYAIAGPGPTTLATLAFNHASSSLLPTTTTTTTTTATSPTSASTTSNFTRTLNPLHLRLDHLSVYSQSHPSIASSVTSQAGGAGGTSDDRKRRVRSGCLTCRTRKVKCDEVRPRCKRCIVASRECCWPSEQAKRRSKSSKGGNSVKGKDKPATTSPKNTFVPLSHDYMTAHHSSTSPRTSPTKSLVTATSIHPHRRSDNVVAIGAGLLGRDRLLEELVPKGMRAKLLLNPSFLHSYFPSVDEKLVMHHYINETVRNIVALDVPPTNPWIEWHAPMAFSVPRGSSLACDALQLAILSIGAIHLRYLAPGGAPPSTTHFARSARARTLAMLRRSIDISTKNDDSEIILGALLSCMISSSLAGDDAWQEILTLAASLIDRRGGIEVFLSKASRSHQSSFRFLMEQLATRDVFGCLTTGVAPTFLSTGFSPWWFEIEGWSAGDDEWESVERMFGVSRAMVDLMARVCTVVAKKRLHGLQLRETRQMHSRHDHIADGIVRVGQSHHPVGDEEQVSLQVIANDLLEEIEVWKSTSHFRRAHPRVQYGNYAHLHAMKVHLLKNAFDIRQDERIHQASRTILELCTETVAMFGRVVWMTWPVLMAGLHLPAHETEHRQTIRNLLLEFAPHAFFDNKLAVSVLQEYWSKIDNGIDADWWSLTRELGRAPFFD